MTNNPSHPTSDREQHSRTDNDCLACWNGETMLLSEVRIPALDRGFLFGDSVYEVIRVYRSQPLFVDQHLRRLGQSLAAIRMSTDINSLHHRVHQLTTASRVDYGYIYIQVTRGAGPRKHLFPTDSIQPNELLFVQPTDAKTATSRRDSGIATITLPDLRWKQPNIKSNNLLPNCMAQQQASEAGAFEALLFNDKGLITEGTASNVFAVFDDMLVTPPLENRILPGITRELILEMAKSRGLPTAERTIRLDELPMASELFVTSTTCEITPVISIDGNDVADGNPGPTTRELQRMFQRMLDETTAISSAA